MKFSQCEDDYQDKDFDYYYYLHTEDFCAYNNIFGCCESSIFYNELYFNNLDIYDRIKKYLFSDSVKIIYNKLAHIYYKPGGIGAEKAFEHFKELSNTQ